MELPHRLEATYRVRFDEAGADGNLRPSGFLRYAQDMGGRHSEVAGFDRDWYGDRGLYWLVRNVRLDLLEPVGYGEHLTISTEVVGWRHVWARRHTEVRRAWTNGGADGKTPALPGANEPGAGGVVARVRTDWVLLDTGGRPARVPAEVATYFSGVGSFERSRVRLPAEPDAAAMVTTRVRPIEIDPMGHMNNAAYLDVVDEAIARLGLASPEAQTRRYRVGYVRPARPDSQLVVRCWSPGALEVACRISDGQDAELTRVLVGSVSRAVTPEAHGNSEMR